MANVAFANFTQDEIKTKYGIDLDNAVPDDGDTATKVSRFITNVCEMITDYIEDNDAHIDLDSISTTQNDIIKRACMIQAKYVIDEGDFSFMSGYQAVANSKMSGSEIASMIINQSAKMLLNNKIIDRGL